VSIDEISNIASGHVVAFPAFKSDRKTAIGKPSQRELIV
jgi:hypothetical protein